ncbi:hypothetical protein ACJRO7_003576 [Eucalyptus globulus]|uniref:Uncharacterized protein n=1 Tax=Eucalyptus globulus TaxID=34317 RepID=A0ABD3IX57_EUCGL
MKSLLFQQQHGRASQKVSPTQIKDNQVHQCHLKEQMTEEEKQKKSTEDEQKPKEVEEESKKADEAKYGPETALQKKKSEDLAQLKRIRRGRNCRYRQEDGKSGNIGRRQHCYVTNQKKLRNLMNTMVAALLIVVLGLYVKHVLRSLGTPKSDPEL